APPSPGQPPEPGKVTQAPPGPPRWSSARAVAGWRSGDLRGHRRVGRGLAGVGAQVQRRLVSLSVGEGGGRDRAVRGPLVSVARSLRWPACELRSASGKLEPAISMRIWWPAGK